MWEKIYASKVKTPDQAVAYVTSGDRLVIGHACSEPTSVVEALVKAKSQVVDIEIVHMLPMGKSSYTRPEMQGHFKHNALFVGGPTRQAVRDKRADFTPCFFYEIPRLFKEEILKVDVAIIQVSPPDAHGYCSFGLSNDYTKGAAEAARLVIAEVNDKMPRVLGDNFIHVSQMTCIVEVSRPLVTMATPKIGSVEETIGRYCASLVEDGSTLQLGIGALPDAVLMSLKDKKDLGIHTEMFSDGVLDLVEAGVINNTKKTLHANKMISTFLMGSQRLYDFVDNNPCVELHPVDYVNDPMVIAKNHKMVSINSCLQVDLMGQVSSESIGLHQYSGTGGQVDYIRGASMARAGKSIIAMPSTASGGKVSRIVAFIEAGTAITTSRNDVHYIVTEYGIADLRGKTLKERGRHLINISHPNFKADLIQTWEERFEDRFNQL